MDFGEKSLVKKGRDVNYAEVQLTALLQLLMKHPDALVKVYLHKAIHLIKDQTPPKKSPFCQGMWQQ